MNYTIFDKDTVKIELGFFKRLKVSIANVENYFMIASDGWKRSMTYLIKLLLIFTLILSCIISIKISFDMKALAVYIQNNASNFEIGDGEFKLESEKDETIETKVLGNIKIIMSNDTNIEKFISNLGNQKEDEIIFLKDKLYINIASVGTLEYSYDDLNNGIGVQSLNKGYIVSMLNSMRLTIAIAIYAFISIFIIMIIRSLMNALLVSLVGRLGSIILGIPLKYSALYSMAISTLTLPIIITLIYMITFIFTGFTINYYSALYMIIAYIYMITAVILMRANYIKTKNEYNKDKEGKEM